MAIAFTRKVSFGTGTDLAAYPTGSWTPTADEAHLASVVSRVASGSPDEPTLSGNGLTWVKIDSIVENAMRVTTFYAVGVASPTTGATTADFAAQTQTSCVIQIDELTDANDAAPVNTGNRQTAHQAAVTTLATAALSAVAAGGAIWAGAGAFASEVQSAVADYTSLGSNSATSSGITLYDADGADLTPEFSSASSLRRTILGIEVVAAATGHTGTGALVAGAPTAAGTGEEVFTGTGAISVPTVAVAGEGTHALSITGTAAWTAASVVISGTGSELFEGTGVLTGQAPTIGGTAQEVFEGTGAITGVAPTINAEGTSLGYVEGTGVITAPTAQVSASGTVQAEAITGTGAFTAPTPIFAAVGAEIMAGQGAITFIAPSIVGTGAEVFAGTGAIVGQAPTVTASGASTVAAVFGGSVTLAQGSGPSLVLSVGAGGSVEVA